jgi:signal transduction histidine kinase
VGWTLMVLSGLALVFTFTFYATALLYQVTGLHPPEIVAQLINSLFGLILMGLIARIASSFFKSERASPFIAIIQALERIARGDFNTRLENDYHDNQIIGELVDGVNKMAVELDQMETMRQEFISNVSHEIQSPLTSIRGFAQVLKSDTLSPQDRLHYLEIIEMESTRLSRLSDDLLKLTSLESNPAQFEPSLYRLDKQIRSLILTCEPQWAAKKLILDVDLQEVSIRASEDLLSQVWLNLIHNSIKFTPVGGTIQVTLRTEGDRVEFRIRDSGIGISDEDQAHIFERFYKADKSRTHSAGGSGLGLAIAKKIVEIHKGSIRVESKVGVGATFIVLLPA